MAQPLRLPPEEPVSELLWFAGGEVDETSVCLRVFGDDLVPSELSDLLGVQPTKSWRKGDVFQGKKYDRIQKTGSWHLSTERQADVSLEAQINQLLDQITPDLTIWAQLIGQYDVDLFCGLWLLRWNREIAFSPQTLLRIAERVLLLDLDIYFKLDEDA